MNQINFLPPGYVDNRARHQQWWRQMLLILALLAGVGVWYTVSKQRQTKLEQLAAMLETQTLAASEQSKQYQALREQESRLNQRLRVQQQLALPVTHTQVLATLSRLMPPPLTLQHLAITCPRATPQSPGAAARSNGGGMAAGLGAMRVTLTGLSPDDGEVANFVGHLTEHVLFSDVKLNFTRPVEINGLTVREFEVEMQLLLEREFLPPKQEVAHAN
jgi:Tfp pilus assembly protein PilN